MGSACIRTRLWACMRRQHSHAQRAVRLAFVCAPPSTRSLASDTHERASSALPVTSCFELTAAVLRVYLSVFGGGGGGSTRSRHLRGGSDPLAVTVKPTKPIAGQKPGTSGQRPDASCEMRLKSAQGKGTSYKGKRDL